MFHVKQSQKPRLPILFHVKHLLPSHGTFFLFLMRACEKKQKIREILLQKRVFDDIIMSQPQKSHHYTWREGYVKRKEHRHKWVEYWHLPIKRVAWVRPRPL